MGHGPVTPLRCTDDELRTHRVRRRVLESPLNGDYAVGRWSQEVTDFAGFVARTGAGASGIIGRGAGIERSAFQTGANSVTGGNIVLTVG